MPARASTRHPGTQAVPAAPGGPPTAVPHLADLPHTVCRFLQQKPDLRGFYVKMVFVCFFFCRWFNWAVHHIGGQLQLLTDSFSL